MLMQFALRALVIVIMKRQFIDTIIDSILSLSLFYLQKLFLSSIDSTVTS